MSIKSVSTLENASVLESIHILLDNVIEDINNDEIVPERYGSSFEAELAESDYHVLANAKRIIHRLMLAAKHPNGVTANYVNTEGSE